MTIAADTVAVLAVVSTALSALLVVAVLVLALRLRVVRRTQLRVFGRGERDVVELLDAHAGELARVWEQLDVLGSDAGELRERLRGAVSRVAVVRYDAFEDMGGALSFSAALLDDHGDGMVLSAINGRAETRCYSKPVTGGHSEHSLSDEERTAVDAALRGERDPAPVRTGRRRRRAS